VAVLAEPKPKLEIIIKISLVVVVIIRYHNMEFNQSFILETYIAPLRNTATQRRSQPSHSQRSRTCKYYSDCLDLPKHGSPKEVL